ncbi:hypothetical protein SAMN05444395_10356 [Flavobacterium fryxellicola]|uniref:Thioredoxin domain-containing protein n=1 Tax=Flavobacterium fryxellicola TaxID=249352 RepID=A0A167X8B6_9FLAO|nr:hypothetical protein [Flavobacterium fryxellicola]OAB28107.1 hypothetical protein FBFR_09680 [Flavobacterium fryxellicola]SHN63856.1 hypothetical protein SAMN05444395_10356 [Flavobacterium fryxellicola]
MKKNIVLFVLFILPIVAYLFFASGVNGFTKLPTVTPNTADFGNWQSLDGKKVTLNGKVTVLGFSGTELLKNRGNFFNLNQKIYQTYHKFKDVQFVVICPIGTEADAKKVVDALAAFTDVAQWRFVFASPDEITSYHSQLKLLEKLDDKLGTPKVYIIDKKRNLRGRKLVKDTKEGYNTFHPAELSNEMLDDFKVILYEYRAALKKNNNATRKI